jgi:dsRNA-specific ribonuclease
MKRDKSGKFKPGRSGNPKGRPKGASNKEVKELRDRINQLLDDNFEQVLQDFKALDPKDRVQSYIKMMEFSLPRLKSVEATALINSANIAPPQIIIGDDPAEDGYYENMSKAERQDLIKRLKAM